MRLCGGWPPPPPTASRPCPSLFSSLREGQGGGGRRAKKLEGPRPPTASSLGAEWSRALWCLWVCSHSREKASRDWLPVPAAPPPAGRRGGAAAVCPAACKRRRSRELSCPRYIASGPAVRAPRPGTPRQWATQDAEAGPGPWDGVQEPPTGAHRPQAAPFCQRTRGGTVCLYCTVPSPRSAQGPLRKHQT